MEPLISIVLPVYNVEAYVEKCIRSILNQNYRNFELIIVNDGSTDKSLELCQTFHDEKIILLNKENGGLSSARNLGMMHCRGEYIAFVDSDDWIENNYLEELVNGMFDEDVDIVQCGYNRQLDDNKTLYKKCFSEKIINNNDNVLYEYFISRSIHTAVWGKLFRKKVIDNIFFKEGHNYEDLIFLADLLGKTNKVKIIDKALYNYRKNKNSITQSSVSEGRIQDILYAYEYFEIKCKNYKQDYSMYISYMFCATCVELYYQLWIKNDKNLNFLKDIVVAKFIENYRTIKMKSLKHGKLGKFKIILFRYNKKITILILRVLKLMNIVEK